MLPLCIWSNERLIESPVQNSQPYSMVSLDSSNNQQVSLFSHSGVSAITGNFENI